MGNCWAFIRYLNVSLEREREIEGSSINWFLENFWKNIDGYLIC